jgi:glucose-6-phosphate dehydrogenase assembly protein OpcA
VEFNALISVLGVGSPALAGLALGWVAMELKYVRRDVDKSHSRIDSVLARLEKVQEKLER